MIIYHQKEPEVKERPKTKNLKSNRKHEIPVVKADFWG